MYYKLDVKQMLLYYIILFFYQIELSVCTLFWLSLYLYFKSQGLDQLPFNISTVYPFV